jgi:3-carboxy-cis,cis-muconate cycloisomerase
VIRTFTTPEMTAVFSGESRLQRMLDFEAALARAEARAGIVPQLAAGAIAACCKVAFFDLEEIERDAALAGVPTIPVVKKLTAMVDEAWRGYVHWGATSQDAIDTGMVLQMREGIEVLEPSLVAVGNACAALAEQHRRTPMAGRTLMQHALPITFGLKAAHWLELASRSIERLRRVRDECLILQFGGAAGTLASLGPDGLRVSELLAEELGLPGAELPWHTDRDRIVETICAVGVAAGAMSKIATDTVLLMQSEVGEVRESGAEGKGGSSTMPQKRNPVDGPAVLASTRLAIGAVTVVLSGMAQEHERSVGAWQAEWRAVPDVFCFTAGAVRHAEALVRGMEVDARAMLRNLESSRGRLLAESLSMKLAAHLGRHEAHEIVAGASARSLREDRDLAEVAAEEARIASVLDRKEIREALDPTSYLGATDTFIDRALKRYEGVSGRR